MASHGNPAGVAAISDQTCARTLARTRAILSRVPGIGQLQRPPHRGVRRRGPEDRFLVRQQGDVVHAGGPEHDRHRHGHQRHTPVHQRELPRPRQRRSQRRGQPHLVGQLAQQHRPGMADQALAVRGHRQPLVPRRILRIEERSGLVEVTSVWLPRNLPRTGRSSPSALRSSLPRSAPVVFVIRALDSPPHPAGAPRDTATGVNRQVSTLRSDGKTAYHRPGVESRRWTVVPDAAGGVVPSPGHQPPVPGEQRRGVTANTSPHGAGRSGGTAPLATAGRLAGGRPGSCGGGTRVSCPGTRSSASSDAVTPGRHQHTAEQTATSA